jgi:1-pyrroline-5-carboxylate dehydrogenase
MTTNTKQAAFINEPFTNFALPENKLAMEAALRKVKAELGRDYPLSIGDEKIMTEDKIISINPGNVDEVLGRVSKASQELAEKAMQAALTTFETWKRVPARKRAE